MSPEEYLKFFVGPPTFLRPSWPADPVHSRRIREQLRLDDPKPGGWYLDVARLRELAERYQADTVHVVLSNVKLLLRAVDPFDDLTGFVLEHGCWNAAAVSALACTPMPAALPVRFGAIEHLDCFTQQLPE